MSRFVRPETRTLTLEDGETLVVRARLSHGEYRAMWARVFVTVPVSPAAPHGWQLDLRQDRLAQITAYLLDWSLKDDDGKPVHIHDLPIDQLEHVLNDLTPDSFDEIHEAITHHIEAMAAEKKTPIGEAGS